MQLKITKTKGSDKVFLRTVQDGGNCLECSIPMQQVPLLTQFLEAAARAEHFHLAVNLDLEVR